MAVAPLNLNRALKIFGWMSEKELQFLSEVAKDCDKILEVGSFQGRSTRALADNSPDNAVIFAVDCWNYNISPVIKSDMFTFGLFRAHLADHISRDKVIPIRKRFSDYNPPENLFDFVFIDGDHYESSVRHDIEKGLKLVKYGGILAGHDYCESWPDVKEVVNEFFPNVNLTESIWWIKKS